LSNFEETQVNIAIFRHRDAKEPVLLPIYLYSSELPTYMKLMQFIDCREANEEKLKYACKQIIQFLDRHEDYEQGIERQYCPICNIEVEKIERYPNYICDNCTKNITDKLGRKIVYYNTSMNGGLTAHYEHSNNKEKYDSNTCYINEIELIAQEAKFGGVVIQPKMN